MVFNPASLTEDYEIGVYVHNAGFRQYFRAARGSRADGLTSRRESTSPAAFVPPFVSGRAG